MFPELRNALTVSYATHLTRLADGHGAEPRVESNIFPPDLGPDIVQTRHGVCRMEVTILTSPPVLLHMYMRGNKNDGATDSS